MISDGMLVDVAGLVHLEVHPGHPESTVAAEPGMRRPDSGRTRTQAQN